MRTNVNPLIRHYHLVLKSGLIHLTDNAVNDIIEEFIERFIIFKKAANVCICISVDIIPVDVAVLVKVLVLLKSGVDRAFKDAVNHV